MAIQQIDPYFKQVLFFHNINQQILETKKFHNQDIRINGAKTSSISSSIHFQMLTFEVLFLG